MRVAARPAALVAAALLLSLPLSSCGKATVESEDTPESTSVAPLERSSQAASSSAAPSSSASEPSAARGGGESPATEVRDGTGGATSGAEDRGAREVSAVPPSPGAQGKEREFLDALSGAGLNTDGVEDQVIGAGKSACNPQDTVTIPAVSGQLITQERTDKSFDELSALITDAARTAFC